MSKNNILLPKTILIVNTFFSPIGGAEIIAYNTYKMLNDSGINAIFWATKKQPFFEENYKYLKYFTNLYKGALDYIKNPIRYFYNLEAKKDLENLIKEIKPDVIHIHGIYYLSSSIFDCCKDIPTVLTMHDLGLVCPSNTLLQGDRELCKELKCRNRNFIPCIKNKCVRNNLENSARLAFLKWIYSKKIKYIDKFITPSDTLRELVLESNIGIESDNIITINNFLSNEQLNTLPSYDNKGYFLYIGRVSKEKGVHYLLKAMKDLPKDIELHIVGTGPEEENLKRYAKENNLENIKFLGFKNREEIKEEYQNCIATILPCNWFENFPTTNMESFINGKPVIASNIGGIPEQVEHNKTGLLFEPGSIEQLKDCILKYRNNNSLVTEHGKNAYEKAKKYYTEDRYYNELIKVYKELIEGDKYGT